MGQYYTTVRIKFNGIEEDEKKFKKLISLMDKEEFYEEEDYENLPIELDDVVQHALFGILEDRGEDSGYCCRFFPDFDLTCAPKMFAALFPDATFELEIRWDYSVGGGETIFFANYADGELTIRQCQTEDDIWKLDEELQNQYEDGEVDLDVIEEALLAVNGVDKLTPTRNIAYEKSFFKGTDLIAYLDSDVDDEDE